MKVMKIGLMVFGTLVLMLFHCCVMIKDKGFNYPIAGQFTILHFIWFDICDRWIEKSIAVPR